MSVKVAADMGGWYYMWYANNTDYDGLTDELNLIYVAQNTENRKKQDFLTGVNNIKPPIVSIGYGTHTDGFVPGGETVLNLLGTCERKAGKGFSDDDAAELIGKTIKVARKGKAVGKFTIISATVK